MALVTSNPLDTDSKLEIELGQEEEAKTGDAAAEKEADPNKKKNGCPSWWLYDLRTCFAGSSLVWVAILSVMLMVMNKSHEKDDDDSTDDTYMYYSNAAADRSMLMH